ncbi:uncharacterized protein B0H18DRAFT_958089 [Fomitopsis serialis]|uniref:uncharacterized protein n=1 Tax=Fomitopsis serialis TaxID=139415 RepID=UPI0020086329|nr:uncharacterized protein B0H18DRAFT_958089 [Neoantrodia serialis]KAH9918072.1 hypothetical protein B0H18DRAFT_958089 [Neoantrodia serialis]
MASPGEIYSQELLPLGRGYAIWEPSPPAESELNVDVELGDVGYFQGDSFCTVFNAFKPADDPRNQRNGVPDGFVPLYRGPIPAMSAPNILPHTVLCSGSVSPKHNPDKSIDFQCATTRSGAVLVLEQGAVRHVMPPSRRSMLYMKSNVESWHEFMTGLGYDQDIEQIRFVMGYMKAPEWAAATPSPWSLMNDSQRVLFKHGPGSRRDEQPADQCVFLHYLKLRRRLLLPMSIKAAAEPHQLPPLHRDDFPGCKASVYEQMCAKDFNPDCDIGMPHPLVSRTPQHEGEDKLRRSRSVYDMFGLTGQISLQMTERDLCPNGSIDGDEGVKDDREDERAIRIAIGSRATEGTMSGCPSLHAVGCGLSARSLSSKRPPGAKITYPSALPRTEQSSPVLVNISLLARCEGNEYLHQDY